MLNIYSVRFSRYRFRVRFIVSRLVCRIIDFLLGLIGYTYVNAQYNWKSRVLIFKSATEDISGNVTEAVLSIDGSHSSGLVRRLRLNERGHAYSAKEYGPPVQYWQWGKFMLLTKNGQ